MKRVAEIEKNTKALNRVLAFLIISVFAICSFGQTGSMEVYVIDKFSGKSSPCITLELLKNDTVIIRHYSPDGTFSINDIPESNYLLKIYSIGNYTVQSIPNTNIIAGETKQIKTTMKVAERVLMLCSLYNNPLPFFDSELSSCDDSYFRIHFPE